MTKTGKLKRCWYSSSGPKLQIDTLVVEFELDGQTHTHNLPNVDWSLKTAALQFIAFIGKKPTDFDSTSMSLRGEVPVEWSEDHQQYLISKNVLVAGAMRLKKCDWFNSDGDIFNSGGMQLSQGGSVEPSTGNRGAVEIEAKG